MRRDAEAAVRSVRRTARGVRRRSSSSPRPSRSGDNDRADGIFADAIVAARRFGLSETELVATSERMLIAEEVHDRSLSGPGCGGPLRAGLEPDARDLSPVCDRVRSLGPLVPAAREVGRCAQAAEESPAADARPRRIPAVARRSDMARAGANICRASRRRLGARDPGRGGRRLRAAPRSRRAGRASPSSPRQPRCGAEAPQRPGVHSHARRTARAPVADDPSLL